MSSLLAADLPTSSRDLLKGPQKMNRVIRIALLCTLAFTVSTASLAQRRGARRKVPTTVSRIICEGDAIPKSYVIVGYKSSAKCGYRSQVLIKKPDEAEIVCDGSPVPEGYHVANQLSSTDCLKRGANSSTNAVSIVSNGVTGSERSTAPLAGDSMIGRAFASRASDIQVEGESTVTRLLSEDLNGRRHQRFIVQLASGQTLLISHNIDLAPRIDRLEVGDSVRFYGEYV